MKYCQQCRIIVYIVLNETCIFQTMFQNLANYLLGSVINQEQGATAEGVEDSSTRLRSVESEDDWVLVDRDSEGNTDNSSVESLDINEDENEDRIVPLPNITR